MRDSIEALWSNEVRQFLINNARYYIEELHADRFRYDEISDLISMNCDSGWSFCRDLTGTLRYIKPRLLQTPNSGRAKLETIRSRLSRLSLRMRRGEPDSGHWAEIFNSDVYENWVNPAVAGNGGSTDAWGPPTHGFVASAGIVIPANGFVVFARA